MPSKSLSGKIDSIVESQKKLEDANRSFQHENERLRIKLQKKEKQNRCGSQQGHIPNW